jgi:hypothetical protein
MAVNYHGKKFYNIGPSWHDGRREVRWLKCDKSGLGWVWSVCIGTLTSSRTKFKNILFRLHTGAFFAILVHFRGRGVHSFKWLGQFVAKVTK